MKLHRFRHKSYRAGDQQRVPMSRRRQRGVCVVLALLAIGLMIAFTPSRERAAHVDGLAGVAFGIAQRVSAQDSPLAPSLSVALETEASATQRAKPAIGDPALGDQRNLLRVAAVIAGVLLVAVIVWRQR